MPCLHIMYIPASRGDDVEKSLKTAVTRIRKAANQDYGPAVVSMVYRYEKGEGVE